MNDSKSKTTFVPKQALAPSPDLYDKLVGDCMEQLARTTLSQIPPIPSGSVIHDNGCGTGAASAAIVAALNGSVTNIEITGTDINESALTIYRNQIAQKAWPASAAAMDSAALALEDNKFTHSIGNAFIFVLPNNGIDALKETYRTLKPDGILLINTWFTVPTLGPLQSAAKATRPAGTPLPRQGDEKWSSLDLLRDVLTEAGFSSEKIEIHQKDVLATTPVSLEQFSTMLWSFIGGTTTVGWQKEDEERWDEAVSLIKEEFRKSDGFEEVGGEQCKLKFTANIAVAVK